MNVKYLCSLDGSELLDIYSPDIDEDIFMTMPENYQELSEFEKTALQSRRETLIEILSKLNDEKKKRYNQIITTQSAIILVCPRCKKVFDSQSIMMKEKTHSDDNQIPIRKPKEHKVISDDRESMDEATNSPFDQGYMSARQIYMASEENVQKDRGGPTNKNNNTMFKQNEDLRTLDNMPHIKQQLKSMQDKYGSDNINIQVQFPE